ncbi:hypothetical protein [Notoacmeibacter marinus]|uniref:hypothetical protein n=1 Tax=Notoacmeibacter marinus TaxID=1876515 RepID=UPI000DF2FF2B|nr:hypothetical protein [Notoacmeibacter marinus]
MAGFDIGEKWPFALAAILMGATFFIHLVAGGRQAVRPLLADSGTMPLDARMTLYYAWHVVSIWLAFATLIFFLAAFRPEFEAIAWANGVMAAAFGILAVVVTVLKRLPAAMLPQWVLFLPVAGLAIWGAIR